MTKRPRSTSGFMFRGRAETGCGMALAIVEAVVSIVCAVALALFLAHVLGPW